MPRHLALLLALTCGLTAAGAPLFNGHDLAGWDYTGNPADDIAHLCAVRPDGVITAAGKPAGFIAAAGTYHDFRLHAEWRWPGKPGNGGILISISSGPKDRVWPVCFQIQLKHEAAGDLLPMAGATFAEPLTSKPGTTAIKAKISPDSEKAVGEWNSCDITCRDATIDVVVNGVHQNHVTNCSVAAGRVGFQGEGTPFELSNVHLESLDGFTPARR